VISYRFLEKLLQFVVPLRDAAGTTAPALPASAGATSTCSPPPPGCEQSNGTRTVPAGMACPIPATSHKGRAHAAAFFRHPDPFRDDVHKGSDDLELWPPSTVELHYAWRYWRGEEAVYDDLMRVALSYRRAGAVVDVVEREAKLQGVTARALGVQP
jgi:hypothetical protein